MRKTIDAYLAYLELERGLSPTTRVSYAQDLVLFESFLKQRRIGSWAQVQPAHLGVSRRLGENGGGGNHRMPPVASHDGTRRARELGASVAVDPRLVRHHPETLHRAAHREQCRPQDVQAIYFVDGGMSDRAGMRSIHDFSCQEFSFSFTQEL